MIVQVLNELHIGLRLIIAPLTHFRIDSGELLLQFYEFRHGLLHLPHQGIPIQQIEFLRQISDAASRLNSHFALIDLLFTGQHLQKGGFARSVAPDQSNAIFPCDQETDLIEKGLVRKIEGDLVE